MTNVARLPRICRDRTTDDRVASLEAQVTMLSAAVAQLEERLRDHLCQTADRDGGGKMDLTGSRPTLRQISLAIALQCGMTVDDLLSECREHHVAHPRQDLMRQAADAGIPVRSIAGFLGMDRSTVVHGIRASRQRLVAARMARHG